ncbi:MAG: hypothetical protein V2J07_06740 [Anaerolineae bacterium]|jgi:hypothetical protein|nr:hypothetical protein [Anaerolineae bacterium]
MTKELEERLAGMEENYPGITQQVMRFEQMKMPPCPFCGSEDTAIVQVGIIGRSISVAAASRKVTLVANSPKPGDYRCNDCRNYFTPEKNQEE